MFPKKALLSFFGLLFMVQSNSAQSNDKIEIKEVIGIFFEGLHVGDTLKIKETTGDRIIMQTMGDLGLKSVVFSDFLKEIAAINPEITKIEEKITSFSIKSDGNMANAWTSYKFYVNSKFSHCGVNSFQLVKVNENWKIIYIIDTRRKDNCN